VGVLTVNRAGRGAGPTEQTESAPPVLPQALPYQNTACRLAEGCLLCLVVRLCVCVCVRVRVCVYVRGVRLNDYLAFFCFVTESVLYTFLFCLSINSLPP